jgi:uncharacterized protein (DUF433 family)
MTSALKTFEQLLPEMTPNEKALVFQRLARDLSGAFLGIDHLPNVCGGDPIIVRTRIPVWLLVQARQLGMNDADLLREYPSLRAPDLMNAWAYAEAHRDAIERQIAENEHA